ncbi:MAG: hydrogenase accessory protein HypB, partial [Vulcanococcus sp.]
MCGQCGCSDTTPGPEQPQLQHRRLELHRGLLSRNDAQAAINRAHFRAHGVLAVNLLSAPGSGKTALLEQLARHWPQRPIAVIV